MRVKVATYNIHKGVANQMFGARRASTIHELRSRMHELSADLIFLQEVLGQHDRHARRFEQWPAERQDLFLARTPAPARATTLKQTFETAYQTAYGRNASYLHGHHGNALLSRFPILREDNRDVSDHALEKRGVLHCEVDIDGVAVHCFVVHFGLFARSRERQADVLIDWVDRAVGKAAPLLIAGDFNDWRDRLSERFYEALQVSEVFDVACPPLSRKAADYMRSRLGGMGLSGEGRTLPMPLPASRGIRPARTFPSLVPWLRMDRIYQRGFHVHSAEVMRGPSWARLSDHAPLVAELELVGATARAQLTGLQERGVR